MCALLGLVAGLPTALAAPWADGALVGWDVACAAYLIWVWSTIWPLGSDETARLAEYEDPTRATADLIVLSAAVASLVAVGFVLANAASQSGGPSTREVGLGLASVALSWAIVHTIFTLRYARDYYYGEQDGGVDFNDSRRPRYSDFAYLAFTIGMTFQVSDTPLQDPTIRRDALRHALLSFLFGTGILATTVNLVASLTSR
ncbi:MAG: hypothetical protein QOE86_1183 [Solirubrobacteraceae bacterium]|nr:hypothetical protein [Solirubrobacteraceae bacterium]